MPERVDLDRLREEAVAAEVEAVAVDLDRLREPADLVLGLEHDDVAAGLAEEVAGGQACRATAEHERGLRVVVLHERPGPGRMLTQPTRR